MKTYDVFTREYWEKLDKLIIRTKERRYWLDMHLSRRDKLIMGRYVRHPRGGIGVAAWTKKIEGITVRKRRKTKEEKNGLMQETTYRRFAAGPGPVGEPPYYTTATPQVNHPVSGAVGGDSHRYRCRANPRVGYSNSTPILAR